MLFRAIVVALAAAGAAGCGASRAAWVPPAGAIAPAVHLPIRERPALTDASISSLARASRLAGLGRRGEAVRELLALIERDPSCLEAHRRLQDLLASTTADWWLRERYETLLRDHPQAADAWYLLARIDSDPDRQLRRFEKALQYDPAHPYARLGRAVALERSGDVRGAIRESRASAESAPWLGLPWLFLGTESLARGDAAVAERFFREARGRSPDDPRPWLGLAQAAEGLARRSEASAAALEALRLAPGDGGVAGSAIDILVASAVPAHLDEAVEALQAALPECGDPAVVHELLGRCLLARGRRGDARAAVEALDAAAAEGTSPAELSSLIRRGRLRCGRYREAVLGALDSLPRGAREADNLYAPRWRALEGAARSLDVSDARSLLRLADAMTSVGWLHDALIVATRARSIAPQDPALRRRIAEESAFLAFLSDVGTVASSISGSSEEPPAVEEVLARIREVSVRRLGRDVTQGAVVRNYPMLGAFALSVASGGAFETEFGSRGLVLLVGARNGSPVELALGRLVLVRADAQAVVQGARVRFDECWIESEGLPSGVAGLRKGLAGLTMDRMVLVQLDAVRRGPRRIDAEVPFELRPARSAQDLGAMDTPSAVAWRIESQLHREGILEESVLDAVRRHELAHVVDATRMLPVATKLPTVLSFLARNGFDGAAVERNLEARAAVTALIECKEPRAALASLLAFLPARSGSTPHAGGYRGAVEVAINEILCDRGCFPSIDCSRNVVQQLDRLTDDEIRELGRRLLAHL